MSTTPQGTSERRVVTVLFADIAGFTALSERLDPETVTDVMNEIFALLGQAVEAVGGYVDKVIGDSLMALFGAPVAHEDDALRAVRAALTMQRLVRARDEAIRRVVGQPIRLRIGIHTGLVVWGSVGPSAGRPTVMGDTVNLASRLQRAAAEGGILVSDAVFRQIKGALLAAALEPIVVKGKTAPVTVYEVLGERERAEPIARPPFIDRDDELEHLEDLLARARRGRAQVAVVAGEAGVGKTRLIDEFAQRLAGDVRLLQAACPPYGGASLGPLADLFRQLAGLHGPVTVEDVEARVPFGERAHQAAVVLSRLFTLTEVPQDDDVPHETALLVAAEAIRRMITVPTVVWLEDVQWADAGTRELLPYVVDRLADAPMLLVITLRPDAPAVVWGRRTALSTLHLDPLAEPDARAYIAGVLGEHLPESVERLLTAKAGGNPFYLNEILATLRRAGTLLQDDHGRWRVTGPVDDVLPDTIHGAVLARLDRLPADLRSTVQRAAVAGASFSASLLADVTDDAEVPEALRALEDLDLVRRRDLLSADPEYVFVHPIVREVAYSSLLAKQRAALHSRIAESLERRARESGEDLARTIGMHHARGGTPEQALPYLIRAGQDAEARYATQEAIDLLETARRIAQETGHTDECLDACERLGELYLRVQTRGPKAWFEVWDFVRVNTDASADPVRRARAAIRAASALIADNRLLEAAASLQEAEALIPPGHLLWSDFHGVRAHLLIMESEYRRAVEAARDAVAIADRQGTLPDRSRAYSQLAHPAILPLLGDEGRRVMRAWMSDVSGSGDERLFIEARHFLVSDVWTRGVVDEELFRTAEEALRKAEDHGWTRDEAVLCMLLGWAHFLVGRWPAAAERIGRAHRLIEDHGGRVQGLFTILLPLFRANLAMANGRVRDARAILEEALPHARFHAPIWLNHDYARCLAMLGDRDGATAAMARALEARDLLRCVICGCQANGIAAEFYAQHGDGARAAVLADAAEPVAVEVGHVTTQVRVHRARARVALQRLATDDALAAAEAALALGRQMPLAQPFEHAQSLVVLGDVLVQRGDADRAVAVWGEAREVFAGLGARWHEQDVGRRTEAAGAR
ncbi:MAG: adenylate/guanylate cyclase domain-containing protein [Armatimonadota bacterium]|nr:adenylate/guanylate cyclase domain-containing protein [Armatimonadota bacterium]